MEKCAQYYAKIGLAVFPLLPRSKAPLTAHGFKDASKDPGQIQNWWKANPDANIGIATGKVSNGVFVVDLDIDEEKGVNGYDSLRDWERAHKELPDTANTLTGRGGIHLLFRTDKKVKSRTALLPGIDIRGDGGYIVAPPSIHPNGNAYNWEQAIAEFGITEADATVFSLLAEGKAAETKSLSVPKQIQKGGRNDMMFRLACSMQAKGMEESTIFGALKSENKAKCFPPLEDDELEKIAKSAINQPKGAFSFSTKPMARQFISLIQTAPDKNGNTKIRQCADNVATVLRQDEILAGRIKYDTMAYSPQYFGQLPWRKEGDTYGEWSMFDDSNLRAYLDTNFGLKNAGDYEDGFNIILNENKFNPIVDFIEALPKWDGKPHIENLLPDYLGVKKDAYSIAVMKLFMNGALARAYHPGCKFDYMLVLVGEQGIGKSTFLRELALNPQWFDDNFNTVEGNAAVERLRGKWILELAELLAMKRQKEIESIKAFLTVQSDSYREPYARRTSSRPRACVFSATTNDYTFLTDRTGNRRYLPVEVNKARVTKSLFDDEKAVHEEFKQAWAEALYIYKTERPKLVMPKSLSKEVVQRQMQFLEEDPWIGMIQLYLDSTTKPRVCVPELWKYALHHDMTEPRRAESNRIHAIMRNEISGWHEVGTRQTNEFGKQRCYEIDFKDFKEVDIPF